MSEITIDSFVREQAVKLRKKIDEQPEFEAELWDYVEAGKEADIIKTVESAVGKGTNHLLTAHHVKDIINKAYEININYDAVYDNPQQTPNPPSDN